MAFDLTKPSMTQPDWATALGSIRENFRAIVEGETDVVIESELTAAIAVLESDVETQLAGKVSTSRLVSAGTGLSGGGDLSADRTLALADTAVTPGSYTNASITVDAQGRLTAAADGAVNAWTEIVKSADQDVTNSTSLVDDSELQFAVSAGKFYHLQLLLFIYVSNAGADYKFALAFPSSTTFVAHLVGVDSAEASQHAAAFTAGASSYTGVLGGWNGGGVPVPCILEVLLYANNAGTLKWRFANNSASSGWISRTKAGSILRWRQLN